MVRAALSRDSRDVVPDEFHRGVRLGLVDAMLDGLWSMIDGNATADNAPTQYLVDLLKPVCERWTFVSLVSSAEDAKAKGVPSMYRAATIAGLVAALDHFEEAVRDSEELREYATAAKLLRSLFALKASKGEG